MRGYEAGVRGSKRRVQIQNTQVDDIFVTYSKGHASPSYLCPITIILMRVRDFIIIQLLVPLVTLVTRRLYASIQ